MDKDDRPRVPIIIVGCGEADRKTKNQADPTQQIAKQIDQLASDANPLLKNLAGRVNEAQQAKAILAGKQGGVPVDASDDAGQSRGEAADDEEGTATAPARNERERKLFELRLRMNQSRAANSKETIEEQKRMSDPNYARKQAEQRLKKDDKKEDDENAEKGVGKLGVPDNKRYLNETAEMAEMKEAKKKKGNPDAFGWDVFNQDSLARAHEKRLKGIQFDPAAYAAQEAAEGDSSIVFGGFGHKPTDAQKAVLETAMEKMDKKK